MVNLVRAAQRDAQRLIRPLKRRWAHVSAVGRRSLAIAHGFPVLTAAAWLHDVGYSPDLVTTGFHALDGAVWCHHQGYPQIVVSLVAHHTGARWEADERGLTPELAVFPAPSKSLLDVLTYLDLTTGPNGEQMAASERIAEILGRYEPDSAVHRAVARSGGDLLESAGSGKFLSSMLFSLSWRSGCRNVRELRPCSWGRLGGVSIIRTFGAPWAG